MAIKQLAILVLLLLASSTYIFSQTTNKAILQFAGQKVISIPRNTQNALNYKQSYESNYGNIAFAKINENEIAFLDEIENQILISNESKLISKLKLNNSPNRGFNFINEKFIVFGLHHCTIYSKDGILENIINLPNDLNVIDNIIKVNNQIFLISANQESFSLKNNQLIKYQGIPISENHFVKSIKIKNGLFSFQYYSTKQAKTSINYQFDQNVFSAKIIGGSKNNYS